MLYLYMQYSIIILLHAQVLLIEGLLFGVKNIEMHALL